jgi:flagellar hook-basal body complex protein FliE
MDITSVGPIRPDTPFPLETDSKVKADPTFSEMMKNAVNYVNEMQTAADDKSLKLALGEIKDVHEVMLAVEKASLSLNLAIEIRNRVIESYQTIMRQQI